MSLARGREHALHGTTRERPLLALPCSRAALGLASLVLSYFAAAFRPPDQALSYPAAAFRLPDQSLKLPGGYFLAA
jgi:hypothetical protein